MEGSKASSRGQLGAGDASQSRESTQASAAPEPAFDASTYGFFGFAEDDTELGGLDGGLEDGIEAPPEEEMALELGQDPGEPGADEAPPPELEDLSFASVFATVLDGNVKGPDQREQLRHSILNLQPGAQDPADRQGFTSTSFLRDPVLSVQPGRGGFPPTRSYTGVPSAAISSLPPGPHGLPGNSRSKSPGPLPIHALTVTELEAQLKASSLQAQGPPALGRPSPPAPPLPPPFPQAAPRPPHKMHGPPPPSGAPLPPGHPLLGMAGRGPPRPMGAPMPGLDPRMLQNAAQWQHSQLLMQQQQHHIAMHRGPARPMVAGAPLPQTALGRRRLLGSKHMEAEEIESILRIQWKSLHSGSPYAEDYYYQAYINKHRGQRNAHLFAPEALRDLAPSERVGAEPAMYVKLEGLGKVAYANLRRPKPLMDLVAEGDTAAGETSTGERPATRPLEEEPLLAARIVIEDCTCLLLDVDDIDRVWAAAGGHREDEHLLRQRRSLLMDAFASSLRLPDGALPPVGGRGSDAVFKRLMALHKGRTLLARALKLLLAPLVSSSGYAGPAGRRPPPLRIVWAFLRNVRLLFSVALPADSAEEGSHDALRIVAATSRLAAVAVEVMRRLESPRVVCDSMAALVRGDLGAAGASDGPTAALLPLSLSGEAPGEHREWLGEVIMALLQRAQELGLAEWAIEGSAKASDGLAVPEGLAWKQCFSDFFQLLSSHLGTLCQVAKLAMEAGAIDAANYAKSIVPTSLIRAAFAHATDAQRRELRSILIDLT